MDRSVRGVHNSLEIFYLPGLKQYSIYSFVLFDFRVFQYFSRPVSKIGKTWLWQGRKTCKNWGFWKYPNYFLFFRKSFLKMYENVRYSIYSRTAIYIYDLYMRACTHICIRAEGFPPAYFHTFMFYQLDDISTYFFTRFLSGNSRIGEAIGRQNNCNWLVSGAGKGRAISFAYAACLICLFCSNNKESREASWKLSIFFAMIRGDTATKGGNSTVFSLQVAGVQLYGKGQHHTHPLA